MHNFQFKGLLQISDPLLQRRNPCIRIRKRKKNKTLNSITFLKIKTYLNKKKLSWDISEEGCRHDEKYIKVFKEKRDDSYTHKK